MKFNVTFEKTFTYNVDVDAEDSVDAVEQGRKVLDKDYNALDHSQEGYWEAIDIIEDGKLYCDNTDCQNVSNEFWEITLTSDFDNEHCRWCTDCVNRDKDMIAIAKPWKDD